MNEYLNIKVTLAQHRYLVNELYFDYCDKNGEFVGNIIVNSKGKIEWHIIDATYRERILYDAMYLYGNNDRMLLDYEDNDFKKERWKRAISLIVHNGLYLNMTLNPNKITSILKKRR